MTHRFQKGLLALLAAGSLTTASAQADSIDRFIQGQMQERGIPGLQLAIVRKGAVVKTASYGLANLQDSIPVTARSVFSINSITKAFTGVAILQLVEAGRLQLHDPISTYLPDLPEAWRPVTVLQLLAHTSGIPDIIDEEQDQLIRPDPAAAWAAVLAMPPVFKPGEKFRYNQSNYLLLGRIIERLSGISFQEFIRREQLEKVGMPVTMRAGFGANKDLVPHAAPSYQYVKGQLKNMFFSMPPFLQTAAGMSSTARELADWIIALQGGKLLKDTASLRALWTPARLNSGGPAGFSELLNGYAAGWPVLARAEHPAVAAVGGGRNALFVYPNDDLAIIVLGNLAGGFPESFIDEVAGFYFPDMKAANGFGLSPSLRLLKGVLEKKGYATAIAEATRLQRERKDFAAPERDVNAWGYVLLGQKRLREALEVFKLNVHLYPGSSNTYDSLGEIYAELGERALAIRNYERALQLDPQNKGAARQLEKLRAAK